MPGPRQRLSLTTDVSLSDLDQHSQSKANRRSQKKHHPRRMPSQRVIDPDAAERVIFSILETLHSLDDLFSLARVNRGFYRVFKRHELQLMRAVLRNQSPPAWEHREVSPPYPEGAEQPHPDSALPPPEYSPSSFYSHHMRDTHVIAALKSLVLTRCQSFLRPETVMALANSDAARAARVDNAFWRIWTFCKIFGSRKGREDDIVGQMDWLRGGPLVHQTGIRSTIMTTDSFDASNALLNAPDHFAKGNGKNGLSAEELYDVTEIWTCMGVLISGLEGRTEQAREFGVYEVTDVRGGDIDGEETMLQEWIYYLSTLGLSAVLDLATASVSTDPSAFIIALEKGWMNWTPPEHGGSRGTFLKEAVARVYEEKIAAMAATTPQADRLAMKQVMRQRIAAHKAEISSRRRTGDCQLVRMSMERPMSEWEGVLNRLGASDENLIAPQPHRHPSNSSVMAGAPTPCPPAPPPASRRQSELIAIPRIPELPCTASAHQMQERNFTGASPQQNPFLQTLAQAKQLDYGSPTEPHPALRSFLDSDSSSRRSSESSISSPSGPAPTNNGRLFSEEAVHPAFRNSVKTSATTSRKQHSSNSSVSSISVSGSANGSSFVSAATTTTTPPSTAHATPNLSLHHHCSSPNPSSVPLSPPPVSPPGYAPPSYPHHYLAASQQQQHHWSPHHRYSHSHPPAHPTYPYSTHPAAAAMAAHPHRQTFPPPPPNPPPTTTTTGNGPSSPTSFLPAHRRRVSSQHPLQQEMLRAASAASPAAATNTAEKAIFRIVEMGFTAEEAKEALRRTDPGDGLRVDRAVEWLLQR
ncbi:UBA-like protein [Macrophomina phaseolina MS6]|uniref:UBA-like protein n=1 Tax=Macrophomina phaseolina (strain MS6) TaxID=1126212 RepID=K2RLR0_MACPH|nr:UBA-like protein [Macrophomina phaseolina MS6]